MQTHVRHTLNVNEASSDCFEDRIPRNGAGRFPLLPAHDKTDDFIRCKYLHVNLDFQQALNRFLHSVL